MDIQYDRQWHRLLPENLRIRVVAFHRKTCKPGLEFFLGWVRQRPAVSLW
jgi:hypothetical protein